MPDITKCTNQDCPLREKCYRFTSPPSNGWQSYQCFEPELKKVDWLDDSARLYTCRYFMPVVKAK